MTDDQILNNNPLIYTKRTRKKIALGIQFLGKEKKKTVTIRSSYQVVWSGLPRAVRLHHLALVFEGSLASLRKKIVCLGRLDMGIPACVDDLFACSISVVYG